MEIRTRYDVHKTGWVNPDKGINFDPKNPASKSKTLQAAADECDINKIMKRYEETGLLADPISGSPRKPMFGDFSNVRDYHAVRTKIADAERAFMLYPAAVRARFDNDVQKLADFLADSKNDKEAVKLGLKPASVLPPEPVSPALPPAPAPAGAGTGQ